MEISKLNMSCNGLCKKYKVTKPPYGESRYATGQKLCAICEIFIMWNGEKCPCCNMSLRTKPRNTNNRKQLQKVNMIKRI